MKRKGKICYLEASESPTGESGFFCACCKKTEAACECLTAVPAAISRKSAVAESDHSIVPYSAFCGEVFAG